MRKLLVAVVTTCMMLSTQSASASEDDSGQFIPWTEAESYQAGASQLEDPTFVLAALRDLEDSEAVREPATGGTMDGYTYQFPEGLELTLPAADDFEQVLNSENVTETWTVGKGGEVIYEPDVTVRRSGSRVAIGFSQWDQQVLKSALATTVLTAAICAIPGVGWLACALAGFVVSVAASYVRWRGICTYGRTLWWYDVSGGSTIQCRYTAPF